MLPYVAIHAFQQNVARVLAGLHTLSLIGNPRRLHHAAQKAGEVVGNFDDVRLAIGRLDILHEDQGKEMQFRWIEDLRGAAQRGNLLRVFQLKRDEEPLDLPLLDIHVVVELVRENQCRFSRLKKEIGILDPNRAALFDNDDELETVMIIITDALRLERADVGALEEHDVLGRHGVAPFQPRKEIVWRP